MLYVKHVCHKGGIVTAVSHRRVSSLSQPACLRNSTDKAGGLCCVGDDGQNSRQCRQSHPYSAHLLSWSTGAHHSAVGLLLLLLKQLQLLLLIQLQWLDLVAEIGVVHSSYCVHAVWYLLTWVQLLGPVV